MKKIIIIVLVVLVAGIAGFMYLSSSRNKDYSFSYDPGDYFVTDISSSLRLLKADLIISMADKRKADFYTANNHRIRDVVIQSLRGLTEADLQSAGVQQTLAGRIIEKLRVEFESEDFIKIYFNEFVIQ